MNLEDFIKQANIKHNNFYSYSKTIWNGWLDRIKITCPIHGDFDQFPVSHLKTNGCYECRRDRTKIKNENMLEEKFNNFIERANKKFNNFFTYYFEEFNGMTKQTKITCPKHGDFYTYCNTHLKSVSGCRGCYNENQTYSFEEFINKANIKHDNLYDYSMTNYINSYTHTIIICKEHGTFLQLPHAHLTGAGCPSCSRFFSKNEILWLDYIGLPRDYQHRQVKISLGKGKGNYFVDGYNPITKTIYEFDGDFWHGNPKYYNAEDYCNPKEMTFGQLYNKTILRNKRYISSGYKLITIWESEFLELIRQS